jgi:hypothetical protein
VGNKYAGLSLSAIPFFQSYGFNIYLFPIEFSCSSASFGVKQHTILFSIFEIRFNLILSWGNPDLKEIKQENNQEV